MISSSKDSRGQHLAAFIIAGTVLLFLLTILNFFVLDRYSPAGARVSVLPDEGIELLNDDPATVLQQDVAVPLSASKGFMLIWAEVEGEGIVRGDRPWQRGRIVFLRRNAAGDPIWDIPHVVGRFWGDTERQWIGGLYRGDDRAESLMIRVELLKATGMLKVHRLLVQPMAEARGFRPIANTLLVVWIALALSSFWWAWGRFRSGRWLIALAWCVGAAAIALSVLPGKSLSPARIIATEAIDLVSAKEAQPREKAAAVSANSFSIAKSGHVVMFFVVGFVIMLARGKSGFVPILLLAMGFGGLCEMLQLYSPHREPAAFDFWLNVTSAGVGAGLAALLMLQPSVGRIARRY